LDYGKMKLNKTLGGDKDMDNDRREFLKKSGQAALAIGAGLSLEEVISGCAAPSQDITFPEEFNKEKFLSWYQRNKLYNRPNPNLKSPHSPTPHPSTNFKDSMDRYVTPGLGYSVPWGEVMVAVAPGVVTTTDEIIGTGRPGGLFIVVCHPTAGKDNQGSYYFGPYYSHYAHVGQPKVEKWQKVNRGDPLCKVPEEKP
jgi:hypothetical protein